MPTTRIAPRRRSFSGNWWSKTKLALTGTNSDGSNNVWGDVSSNVLPSVLAAISTYYLGSPQLGNQVGNLINTGLDSGTNKILRGTDAQQIAKDQRAQDAQRRGVISGITNAIGGAYTSLGGKTYSSGKSSGAGTKQENKILDDALSGVSRDSLSSYLSDNASSNLDVTGAVNALSSLTNLNGSQQYDFDPSRLDPDSALLKFFTGQNDSGLGGIINNYAQASGSAGKNLDLSKGSTIGMIGDSRELDNKSRKPSFNFESSLPYSNPDGFWKGGKTVKRKKISFASGGKTHPQTTTTVKKKFSFSQEIPKKKTL